jgi:hypothetical protein
VRLGPRFAQFLTTIAFDKEPLLESAGTALFIMSMSLCEVAPEPLPKTPTSVPESGFKLFKSSLTEADGEPA